MDDEIKYPKRTTEAEVQSELWFRLKNLGLDARLEVKGKIGGRRCIFDIVIFKNETPQSIIECKSWSRRYSKERIYQKYNNTRQLRKYNKFGLPVFLCGRPDNIEEIIDAVFQSYKIREFEHI